MIAAFIDRDGTINEDTDLLTKKEQIRIIPGAIEGIKILNGLGILAIIVTNQQIFAGFYFSLKMLKLSYGTRN